MPDASPAAADATTTPAVRGADGATGVARSRRASRLVRVLAVLGWILVLPLLALGSLRLAAPDAHLALVAANMFSFWLYLPAYAVLPVAAVSRRRILTLASGALVLLHASLVAPVVGSLEPAPVDAAPPPASRLRLAFANVLYCNERAEELYRELLAAHPDVLVVVEHSSRWEALFARPEAVRAFPHRLFQTREDAFGAAIYARVPLEDAELLDLLGVPLARATVRVGGRPVRLYGVHPLPPRRPDYHVIWERQMATLDARLRRERGAVVLAGDLNASPYNAWYRRLTSGRLRSAHEDRGRGLATTWPNGLFALPSVRLDHVLVSPELRVREVREGRGAGSDHQPVFVDLVAAPARTTPLAAPAPPPGARASRLAQARPSRLRPANDPCASR